MKKKKNILGCIITLVGIAYGGFKTFPSIEGISRFSELCDFDVEALTSCESTDGYVLKNCQPKKKTNCYDGEFVAKNCEPFEVYA